MCGTWCGLRWWVCGGGCAVVGVRGDACEAMWAVWVCGHVRNLRAHLCVRVSGHSLFYSTPPGLEVGWMKLQAKKGVEIMRVWRKSFRAGKKEGVEGIFPFLQVFQQVLILRVLKVDIDVLFGLHSYILHHHCVIVCVFGLSCTKLSLS